MKNNQLLQKLKLYVNSRLCEVFSGIFILLIIYYLTGTTYVVSYSNRLLDSFISSESKHTSYSDPGAPISSDIVFFDIDHETYAYWQYPTITPRDKIADLLDIAHAGNAKVIILDIILDSSDYSSARSIAAGEPVLSGTERDEMLKKAVIRIKEKGNTKLILSNSTYANKIIRNNILDKLIDNTNIFQAFPKNNADFYDHRIRYWQLFFTYKEKTGTEQRIWSTPVLAAMLANDINPGDVATAKGELTLNGKKMKTSDTFSQNNRIRYFMRPGTEKNQVEKQTKNQPDTGTLEIGSIHRKISHGLLVNSKRQQDLAGKIVIIGNSSPDCGDIHPTPLGNMAGMFILGNTLNTLLLDKTVCTPPLFLEIILTVAGCILLLRVNSFQNLILRYTSIGGLLALSIFVTYKLFVLGNIFINVLLPFLFIGLIQFTEIFKYLKIKNKGAD